MPLICTDTSPNEWNARGAEQNFHLCSETRDRLFMLPERLEKPTEQDARAIFEAIGITGGKTIYQMTDENELQAVIKRVKTMCCNRDKTSDYNAKMKDKI